ncbi:MAG: dockerin type I domain-containing protein, partial [Defluviitaleaceae bacterium]|nr:dockerin type I domain-containing protein [Defluviitaleaceae bacterium]
TIAADATGTARQRTVTVTGTGLTAANVQVIAGNSATATSHQSSVTVGTPTINAQGTSATVVLTFPAAGANAIIFHIRARTTTPNTSWATAPTTVTVSAAAAQPEVTAVSVGGTQTIAADSTARTRTVTVTGTGLTAANLQVIAGNSATATSHQSSVTVGTPTINAQGTSATVVLTFPAASANAIIFHIRARTTNPNTSFATAPTTVTVSAAAQTFGISLSQTSTLTFPSQILGYGEQEWFPITVTNTGNQPTGELTINTPTGFSIQGRTQMTRGIGVGETQTFDVRPSRGSAVGTHNSTVTVSGGNGISASFNVSFTVNAPPCADCGTTPCICLPRGRLVRDVQFLDTANIAAWSIQDNLRNGDTVYGDRTNIFTSVPNRLLGAERLQVSANARTLQSDTVEFIARENIFVYVGLDERRNSADLSWLNNWQRTEMILTATDQTAPTGPGITYNLYRIPLAANKSIRLGTNGPSGSVIMYTVFFERDVGEHTVIFNANGGTFSSAFATSRTVSSGGSVGILPRATETAVPLISRAGFRFAGWFENPADDNTRWRDNDTVNRSVVLFAKWLDTPANFLRGDANRDGSVSSADLVTIARHLVGQSTNICLLSADLNGDGNVTLDDMMMLLRLLVGYDANSLLPR